MGLTMISAESRAFFNELTTTPSPSGYEQPVQRVVRDWAQRYADEVRTDVHGSVVATRNAGGSPRILLDGHCDQIGLMVQHIDKHGFLYFQPIGGWDTYILLGQSVVVWTESGPVDGAIGRKAKHLQTASDRKGVPQLKDLWIDIGVADREEAQQKVRIGDPVTVRLGTRDLPHDRVCGPKMDNSAGLFVVFETLRRLHEEPGEMGGAAVFFVSAVQEEVGLRGARTAAFGIDPDIGIAVDVTHATDCPTIDKREHGEINLGDGPVVFRGPNINPVLHQRLCTIAEAKGLAIQHKGANRGTPNDANVLQLTRAGVATAALGIPNRYMHTPAEIISLRDLDTAASLLCELVRSAADGESLIPGE